MYRIQCSLPPGARPVEQLGAPPHEIRFELLGHKWRAPWDKLRLLAEHPELDVFDWLRQHGQPIAPRPWLTSKVIRAQDDRRAWEALGKELQRRKPLNEQLSDVLVELHELLASENNRRRAARVRAEIRSEHDWETPAADSPASALHALVGSML
jgi:hypothetical protein